MSYEYKVVPAPARGVKAKGLKTVEDRFAHALEMAINELAADGWEYLRADTLPCEQRDGLMGKSTVFQNVLVFQRNKRAASSAPPPTVMAQAATAPKVSAPVARRRPERPQPVVETPGSEPDGD